jgi:hypothetical protein
MITNNDYLVHIHEEMLLLLTLGLGIKAHKSFIVDGDIIDMIEMLKEHLNLHGIKVAEYTAKERWDKVKEWDEQDFQVYRQIKAK